MENLVSKSRYDGDEVYHVPTQLDNSHWSIMSRSTQNATDCTFLFLFVLLSFICLTYVATTQGSLFAEMTAMLVLAIRLPIVIVVSAPVMMELLTGPCYLDSKSHSLLMNCGQEIFSLEEFFNAAYACNGHFWRILAKAGNFLSPGFAQTFINGMAAVGENSGASTFMPGIIGAISKVSANNPLDSLSNVQDLIAGGSRYGPMSLFMKAAINPIASAHWTWRMASRVIVQCIQASQEKRSMSNVFWNVVYEGRVDYKELISARMFNTCGGLALMAGYFTPMGNTVLHYCFAGVKSSTATLDLVSIFMVDLPVIVCICKQTTGENPASWIVNHCEAPDGLKPRLRKIMDAPDTCAAMMKATNANLTGVFDDVFGELFTGTSSVGSVLDSFVAAVDPEKAGQCDNFETNPYVVTLIPEPADYWRVCGQTDFCKLRCQQQMEAFEKVRPGNAIRSTTTTQTVQSLFFPSLNADAYNPFTAGGVVALTELNSCTSLCVDSDDRCFLMAGFVGSGKLSVAQYCVPSALARGVSKSGSWETLGISGLSTEIQFIKASIPGGWRDVYCVVAMQDQKIQACARLTCAEFKPSDIDLNALGFQKMQSLGDVIVLQVRARKGDVITYCLRFNGKWKFTTCATDTNLWDQTMYHVVNSFVSDQVILLPYDEVPLQVCDIDRKNIRLNNCQQYEGFERQNVPVKTKGLQSRVSQSTSIEYSVFVASNDQSHWLTMLFVDVSGTQATSSVGNSMSVRLQYTLQQGCSLNSCIGCTQLSVQRLCFAAQRCQVARCIGSQVNQIRPLCAIGGSVESTMFAMLATVQGVWTVLSSALSTILDISGGIDPPKAIKWPDQVFYGLICSLKDTIASQVSILTSMVNGLMQSSMPVIDQTMGDTVDNQFLATFTLTMTAVTKFLFQLCLAPLYAAIAAQKVVVCQANSLIAVASGNTVSIGDPDIQTASTAAAGACMTQFSTENSQGTNSGVDNGRSFTSASMDVITQLSGLAMALPLDAIRHPIDVMFTYALGVVRGLQDILQTTDQRK